MAPLARYFFHLRDGGDSIIDPEGRELGEMSAIESAALRDARGIISHEALRGEINFNQSIQVRDRAGALVHELQFRDAVTING